MTTIDKSLFDKEAFRQWLEEQPAQSIIGHAQHCYTCPLARWLNSKGLMAEVGSDSRAIIRDGSVVMMPQERIVDLPAWAHNFVSVVDEAACQRLRKGQGYRDYEVSREEALKALA